MSKADSDKLLQLTREVFRRYFASLVAKESGGSQTDFSRKTGIPSGDISELLTGRRGRYVTVDVLVKVAAGLNTSLARMLGELAQNIFAIEAAGEMDKLPDVEVVTVVLDDGSEIAMPRAIAARMKSPRAREAARDAPRPRPKPPKRKPGSDA